MYTLRTIDKDGLQQNTAIGNEYLYADRYMNGQAFREAFMRLFGVPHVADLDESANDTSKNCVGILTTSDGVLRPIWRFHDVYVMTESGQTFSRLSRGDHG